ncbi:MAG: DUF4932 domain-containing protein [Deltaproteobacteria bacterium]|nr:DUF4932 domain-containing protein [Deltaproteobacteria bacterium]
MNPKLVFFFIALFLGGSLVFSSSPLEAAEKSGIQVLSDPRVELMSIVFRLAGNPEYNMPNSKCPYTDEVEKVFRPFSSHPVVKTAARLRREYGVSYDAPMSLAVHLDGIQKLKLRVPLAPHPANLDKRWKQKETELFLEQARDFMKKTAYRQFLKKHEKTYLGFGKSLEAKIRGQNFISWFEDFFGERPGLQTRLLLSAVNGGQSYGTSFLRPDGSEEVYSIIGMYEYDGAGRPVFRDSLFSLIVHEFAHSYVNPLILANQDKLEDAVSRLFGIFGRQMSENAYGTWQIMACETLVRATVQLYLRDQKQADKAALHLKRMKQKGFGWVGALADELDDYRKQRKQKDGLKAFLPRLVEFFEKTAKREEERKKVRPAILSMTPANGTTDVNPNLAQIQVVFDRPMRQGWSLVGGGKHHPEMGKPSYDSTKKIFSVPVKLKPNWAYKFWLNSQRFQNFASAEGVSLLPIKVEFKTRGK